MGASKNWVLAAAILGSSMTFIDGSAVNVVLPILQRDFQAGSGDVQWVVEAYALFLSALILVGGSLGDLLGRRKMFVLGVAIFAASSAACALAPTIAVLIAARAVQGIGAALAMPESLALISATYTGEARGRAIGTWSGFASLTGAAGPVIGGFLAQVASWRYVFVINLPLALIVLWIAARHVPESRDENMARTIDLSGAALATLGLGALVFGLIQWQGAAQPTVSAIAIGLGCLLLIAFVLVERRVAHPMLPLGLFRSRPFTIANVYTLLLYTALGGSLYFLPFMLIDVQRYTPTAAGAAFLPFVLLQVVFSRWAGSLVARVGARRPLILGALLCTLAFVVFALPGIGGSYWATYFPAVLLLGIGGVFFIAPLTTTVFDSSDPALSGTASAINNAIARTAGLVAVAVFGVVLAAVFDRVFDGRLAQQHVTARTRAIAVSQRTLFIGGTVPAEVPAGDRAAVQATIRVSYLSGFRTVMLLSGVVCLAAAGSALGLQSARA